MIASHSVSNPFSLGEYLGKEYFCDRRDELDMIVNGIVNGRNMVIISPRRLGKTGLIRRTFDEDVVKNQYHTFYIDIYATSSLAEFVFLLSKSILATLRPNEVMVKRFVQALSSLRLSLTFDAAGKPEIQLSLGDIRNPETTLDELFEYIDTADKPCVVAIDEFQQIAFYGEKNMEALLRTKIQSCRNGRFLFAGSRHHLLTQMFTSPAKPFYMSAITMGLKPLHREIYADFAMQLFAKNGKRIEAGAIDKAYETADGITWFMQALLNYAYSTTLPGGTCQTEDINQALSQLLAMQDMGYMETMSKLSVKQKQVLLAIAAEKRAMGITSGGFIARHHLPSASSVQSALRPLVENEIVYQEDNTYLIHDRFFGEWLRRKY